MALPLSNGAEGGTQGTTITTGNTGGASGNAPTIVTINGTSTAIFDGAVPGNIHGALGYKFTTDASKSLTFMEWRTIGNVAEMWGRVYLAVDQIPDTAPYFITMRDSAGTIGFRIGITTTAHVNAQVGAVTQKNGTTTLTVNTLYRCEWDAHRVDGVSDTLVAKLFAGDSTTALETITANVGASGIASIDRCSTGFVATAPTSKSIWIDGFQVNGVAMPGPVQDLLDSGTGLQSWSAAASSEISQFVDAATALSSWDASASVEAEVYADGATALASFTASALEGKEFTDTANFVQTFTPSAPAEGKVFTDTDTALPTWTPSAAEGPGYTDTDAFAESFVASALEGLSYADAATALTAFTASGTDIKSGGFTSDTGTGQVTFTPSSSDVALFIDTVSFGLYPSLTLFPNTALYPSSATAPAFIWVPSALEGRLVDADVANFNFAPSSLELIIRADTAQAVFGWDASASAEILPTVDSATALFKYVVRVIPDVTIYTETAQAQFHWDPSASTEVQPGLVWANYSLVVETLVRWTVSTSGFKFGMHAQRGRFNTAANMKWAGTFQGRGFTDTQFVHQALALSELERLRSVQS